MQIVAVIPVKHVSERVESKNFRDFYQGQSLLDIKIMQLKQSNVFDEIYISSDSPKAEKAASEHGVEFLKRDVSLCNNITPWSDVIYEVVSSLPSSGQTHVAWCHTTSPIFSDFKSPVQKYIEVTKNEAANGLVAVSECKEFILDGNGNPVNYFWGPWHKYSQHLKKHFFVSGALFMAQKTEMMKNRYVISTNPYLYEAMPLESIDIDSEFDYEFARYSYNNLVSGEQ